TKSGTGGDA
ncbi:hypothetical protein EC951288_1688B, partial [Escherichia coli 95.1288]